MTACAYCCIVEEYSSKKILVKHAEGLMNISQKVDLVRTVCTLGC